MVGFGGRNDVLRPGPINLPAVLKAVQKAGVLHYYTEDESLSITTQVPQSIAYLEGLIEFLYALTDDNFNKTSPASVPSGLAIGGSIR